MPYFVPPLGPAATKTSACRQTIDSTIGVESRKRGCLFDLESVDTSSTESSPTSISESAPMSTTATLIAHGESANPRTSVEDNSRVFHAWSFLADDLPRSPGSSRPRLHRRGGSRGHSPQDNDSFIRLQPASPLVQTSNTGPAQDLLTSHDRRASAESYDSLDGRSTTVWPVGDQLSPDGSPIKKTFPRSNALNLEGVPTSVPATPEETSDIRPHQRSASSTGLYGPSAHLDRKVPMIRKKSGEVVRSSLKNSPQQNIQAELQPLTFGNKRTHRAKSLPSTPLGPKNVHFDSNLERVKLFLAQQKPNAVSRQGSPDETTEEESESYPFPSMNAQGKVTLNLPNFVHQAPPLMDERRNVYVSHIMLHADTKTLRGSIFVRNLAFHKRVVVRFTLDDWQTTSEVAADYAKSLLSGCYDEWIFSIKLSDLYARIHEKKLVFAVRYSVNDTEYWDNNSNRNYIATFSREGQNSASATPSAPKSRRPASQRRASDLQWSSVATPKQATKHANDVRHELNRLIADDKHEVKLATINSKRFSGRYDFDNASKGHPARASSLDDLQSLMSPRGVSNSPPLKNFNRTDRFQSFPPRGWSYNPRPIHNDIKDDLEASEPAPVEHIVSTPKGIRSGSPPPPPPTRDESASPSSSDTSLSSPMSLPTSLDSPDLSHLQRTVSTASKPEEKDFYHHFLKQCVQFIHCYS